MHSSLKFIVTGLLWGSLSLLFACGWVDSTGVQRAAEPPVVELSLNTVVDLIEDEPMLLDPVLSVDPRGEIVLWRWSENPVNQGDLSSCSGVNGFNPQFVQDSLAQACTSPAGCAMEFEQITQIVDGSERTVFRLEPPLLRAPVGVVYQLFGTDADGLETVNDFTFCLIAVNQAPDAQDDMFIVLEDEVFTTSASGPNLLSNDSDDIDISNLTLRVLTEPVEGPRFAADFEIFPDGSFTYLALPGFTGSDSFTYSITDGFATNDAVASLTIQAVNAEPMQLDDLPDLDLVEGVPVDVSLAEFFVDPEGGTLVFSAQGLPPGLELDDAGNLGGIVTVGAAGNYTYTISVSDGTTILTSDASTSVAQNMPPDRSNLPRLEAVEGSVFTFDASDFFEDPEQQPLLFTLSTPANLDFVIDARSGVISGVPSTPGRFRLTVGASDGINPAVTRTATLDVDSVPNRRPVYTGAIANQTVDVGEPITAIVPGFSDPDGDELSFEISDDLPAGLTFDEDTGRVSGIPTRAGIFRNLVIEATDEGGLSVTSDTFNLTIVEVEEVNQLPEITGIADQRATVDEPFALQVSATDDDDDDLLFSLVGTAAPFLDIDARSGEIEGEFSTTGTFQAIIIVSDGTDQTTASFLILATEDSTTPVVPVTPPVENQIPTVVDIPNRQVTGVFSFTVNAQFTDPDDDTLTFSTDDLPVGVGLSANGVISGISSAANAGNHFVSITASDGQGGTVSDGFRLTIVN